MTAPTIVITETIGLTNVSTAETTTNFAGFRHAGGGTPTPQLEADIFVQGSNAVSIKTSGATRDEGVWFTNVGSVDMTTDANKHLYIWAAATTMSQHDTIALGGFYIIVGSSTADWNKYFVNGSDTVDGRFVRYVIDVTKKPSETAATAATLTAVTHIGIGVKGTITAKSENVILDRIDFGTGLAIEDGDTTDPCTWEALYQADDDINNRYGIIEKRSGVYFVKGGLQIGDNSGTKTSLWLDKSNATVVFEDPQYHNGDGLVSAITASSLYTIVLEGNATGTTDIAFGEVIGAGDSRQGINGGSIRSAGPKFTFDGNTNIADLDTVEILGVSFFGAGVISLSDLTKTLVAGTSFNQCDRIESGTSEWLNNLIIAPVPRQGITYSSALRLTKFVHSSTTIQPATKVWSVDISTTPETFVDETADFNDAGASDIAFFPATEAVGDYCAFGCVQQFAIVRIVIGSAGTGGAVAWEYWNGTSWSLLEDLEDPSNGLTAGGARVIRFRIPRNWVATSLNGETPTMYVRARVTSTYTINPLGSSGRYQTLAEDMVYHQFAGNVSYDGLEFFGTGFAAKLDIGNAETATGTIQYPTSNANTSQQVGNGTTIGIAESFTSPGIAPLTPCSIRVQGSKFGSPTGNVVARIYAHSGSLGTSSIPTGAFLAESNPVDVSAWNTSLIERLFEFEDEVLLTGSTNYVVAIEYSGGDGSNYIQVGYDSTTPSYAGNKSTLVGTTWSAQSTHDMTFILGLGNPSTLAILNISATNGANPTTDNNYGQIAGATIITNAVTLTVNVEDEAGVAIVGAQVAIFTDDANSTQLMNESTIAGGIATESFNFISDQDITIRVRESPNSPTGRFIPFFTRGTITVDGFSLDVILQDDDIASVT